MKYKEHYNKKVIWASSVGNMLEYYDFSIYGFLSPIISSCFFPTKEKNLSILLTLGVYAIGFIARPIGGVIFGYYGDTLGRKKSLTLSIFLMALASCLIGLLPTYKDIGIYSSYLLIILRFIQGIAMGGEYSGSVIFSMEHNSTKILKNLSGAFIASSTLIGCLLACTISSCFFYFNSEWIWRGPFLLGALIGIVGGYLRLSVSETPEFTKNQRTNTKRNVLNHIKEILDYKKQFFCSLFLIALTGITSGISTTFFSVYFYKNLGIEMHVTLQLISIGLIFYVIFSILSGFLNSFVSPYKIFFNSALILCFVSPIILNFLSSFGNLSSILCTQIIFSSLSGLLWGNINQITFNLFPPHIRYTALALSDSLGRIIFAGTIPIVANTIVLYYNSLMMLGLYVSVFCLVCCCLLMSIRRAAYFKHALISS